MILELLGEIFESGWSEDSAVYFQYGDIERLPNKRLTQQSPHLVWKRLVFLKANSPSSSGNPLF